MSLTTLGQETRWAYSTTHPRPHGAADGQLENTVPSGRTFAVVDSTLDVENRFVRRHSQLERRAHDGGDRQLDLLLALRAGFALHHHSRHALNNTNTSNTIRTQTGAAER